MELYLKDGDYLPDGKGGFRRAQGREELLQRVLWKLTVRRESLARQYAAEALSDETGLAVTAVETAAAGERLEVTVRLDWQGESLDVKLDLEG